MARAIIILSKYLNNGNLPRYLNILKNIVTSRKGPYYFGFCPEETAAYCLNRAGVIPTAKPIKVLSYGSVNIK